MFLIFPLKAMFIKISSLAGAWSLDDAYQLLYVLYSEIFSSLNNGGK